MNHADNNGLSFSDSQEGGMDELVRLAPLRRTTPGTHTHTKRRRNRCSACNRLAEIANTEGMLRALAGRNGAHSHEPGGDPPSLPLFSGIKEAQSHAWGAPNWRHRDLLIMIHASGWPVRQKEVEGSGIKRVAGALSVYISQVSAGTCPRFVLWVSFIKWGNERDV